MCCAVALSQDIICLDHSIMFLSRLPDKSVGSVNQEEEWEKKDHFTTDNKKFTLHSIKLHILFYVSVL